MPTRPPDTEELLDRSAAGDREARGALLERHRDRLRRMVAVRLDRRLAARVDASDVVQEALAEAERRLDDYLRERPVAFYPWLRRLVEERLVEEYRRHVGAARRSVTREGEALHLSDASTQGLAERLLDPGAGPSEALRRQEANERLRSALAALPAAERGVLVLRYMEGLSAREVGEVLGVSESAAKTRALRALKALKRLLGEASEGGQ
jgi:RNA polymerase sigma-70 factor (ECF subfamily)